MPEIKKKSNNAGFILFTIISCIIVCSILITMMPYDKTDIPKRNIPNVVTVIGTVLTIGGLIFAIREQSKLQNTTTAIALTTLSIENKVRDIHYEMNILNSIKCLEKIEIYIGSDMDSKRIHVKLEDLHSSILECKKILENNQNTDNTAYPIFCSADAKIVGFSTQIISSDYGIKKLKTSNTDSFSNFVVGLKRDLNQLKKVQYFI